MSRRPAPNSRAAAASPRGRSNHAASPRGRSNRAVSNGHGIPDATVARLPVYLRALYALADHGVATVSSEELAAATGVNSAKLRKDLSHLGSYGTRGVGYDVEYLVYQVSRELGLTQDWPVLIVGAGNLGRALANYGGFASRGFRIAALVDSDPQVVGTVIARHMVRGDAEIEQVIDQFDVSIGVIATPAGAAQNVCDRLVAAGVTSILNFAPVVLSVPPGVDVRKVDLSIELQILAFHAQRRSSGGLAGAISAADVMVPDVAAPGIATTGITTSDIAGPALNGGPGLDVTELDYRTGAQAIATRACWSSGLVTRARRWRCSSGPCWPGTRSPSCCTMSPGPMTSPVRWCSAPATGWRSTPRPAPSTAASRPSATCCPGTPGCRTPS
jgi:redox-sensing transcriptional repressor